jgi:UDP:flavonoid glycosyltransferase YjiC (YdhE family)
MKVLLVSMPATGHLNPLLGIGDCLLRAGHEVVGMSGSAMRGRIEGIGAGFRPFQGIADVDLRDVDAAFPQRKAVPAGLERVRFDMERIFVDPVPDQHASIQNLLREFPADVIIADAFVLGVLPMLLGPVDARPRIVASGSSILVWHRDDGAPHLAGLPPAASDAQRQEYAGIAGAVDDQVFRPAGRALDEQLIRLGAGPLSAHLLDAMVQLPDAYLQLTAPGFEFPRRDLPKSVRFIGALPIIPGQAPLPPWADEIDGSRKVVLVTQGTVSNHDFGELVAPTLAALANEPDVMVMVTCGGRPVDSIPGPVPGNARVASYLPFEWALAKADVFVTNGGYGSVNQAMSFGVPIVGAGQTEDKTDVNARIAWSGVGIDLKTNTPTPQALRTAVRAVLDQPQYRARVSSIARELAGIDTRAEILRIVEQPNVSEQRRSAVGG